MRRSLGLMCFLFLVLTWCASAPLLGQERPAGGARGPMSRSGGGSAPSGEDAIKAYDEVITKDAVSRPGLFLTHRVGDKLYYELPRETLAKDMLWVTSLSQTQAGYSYGGMPVRDRVVRWELRDEKTILLRDVNYAIRADTKDPIHLAVEATSVAPIIRTFPVRAWGKDKNAVIEVTSLFTSDISEFSPRRSLNAQSLDSSRTFLEDVKAFPKNIEVKVLATYGVGSSPSEAPSPSPRRSSEVRRDPSQSGVTVLVHHSMLILPEKPMKPRVHDERVGFFTVGFEDYADDANHQVENVRFVTRWRLEKKDPNADVSEPVQPIVFYVAREVPEVWQPYVKKGIEAWQPAFEAAGFKNAIIGKLAPSPQEDPDWDAEDARTSTIRWLPSTTENAFGPHVHDPRTGEILEADVRIYHNVLKLARDWYFVQASPSDPRAQKLPMPDELIGELLAYIVAHEVGHSLGFPHNMKASSAYTVANLRDPEFTKKNGTEASIMDYGRFNYVAQPGDNAALIPVVGPYDFFAVDWGYRQYKSDEEEQKGLAALYAKQINDALLRFGDADPSEDPTRQTEDLSGDSIEATQLGLKNLDRVAGYLIEACCKPGEDYELLQNMYDQVLSQRARELMHVTAVVGGFEQINLYFGDAEQIYHPIAAARQREAVKFLIENGLATPQAMVDPNLVLRLETSGAADRILNGQAAILRSLLSDSRLKRMTEHAQRTEGETYQPAQLLADLRAGIWSELEQEAVKIDLYRRNLQRAHVDLLISRFQETSTTSDLPALARVELIRIRAAINRNQAKVKDDPVLTAHLGQLVYQINNAFEPRPASAPAAEPTGRPGRVE